MSTLRNDLIKLAYEEPHFRVRLVPILKTSAVFTPLPDIPAATFAEFWKERYDDGKKQVANPNRDTKEQYPQVSASTAFKNQTWWMGMRKECRAWIEARSKKTEDTPSHSKGKADEGAKQTSVKTDPVKFSLPKNRFEDKVVAVHTLDGKGTVTMGDDEDNKLSHVAFGNQKVRIHDLLDLAGISSAKAAKYCDIYSKKSTEFSVTAESDQNGYVSVCCRELSIDSQGKKTIYNSQLFLTKAAPKGTGTRIFANQVAKAREMGFDYIKCEATRQKDDDNPAVGYKVWPKMGYDGPVPHGVKVSDDMKSKFKAAGLTGEPKVSWFYQVEDGEEWWSEHGDTFKAVFDLTPGSRSLEVHDKYIAKKAKEAGQTVEEFMSKIAAKADANSKPSKSEGKGDNVTLEPEDHKILDEIWKSMRK